MALCRREWIFTRRVKVSLFPYPRSNLQLEIALTQWRAGEYAAAERTLVQLLRENPACTPAVTWLMSIRRQQVTRENQKS
ncbi:MULTISPECIES: hypothetical protein [unclassified Acidithiobacillus]|uniref:hypothetical protein n=1 Tax=unclassified Acidithiobacillus TaxID=2614800 RepID=UPI00187A72C8|nr:MULTISPECIES: hypothetical protein [unclassified Acidithiobacillus]